MEKRKLSLFKSLALMDEGKVCHLKRWESRSNQSLKTVLSTYSIVWLVKSTSILSRWRQKSYDSLLHLALARFWELSGVRSLKSQQVQLTSHHSSPRSKEMPPQVRRSRNLPRNLLMNYRTKISCHRKQPDLTWYLLQAQSSRVQPYLIQLLQYLRWAPIYKCQITKEKPSNS